MLAVMAVVDEVLAITYMRYVYFVFYVLIFFFFFSFITVRFILFNYQYYLTLFYSIWFDLAKLSLNGARTTNLLVFNLLN